MLYSCDEVFLCGARIGGDKDRVVSADVADHLGPVAAIKCECYPLCCADCGSNDQQIGPGGLNRSKQLGDGGQLIIVIVTCGRQLVFIAPTSLRSRLTLDCVAL